MSSLKNKKAVYFILIIGLAVLGYVGYNQFIQWHRAELQTAVTQKEKEMTVETKKLEDEVKELKEKVDLMKPQAVPEEKISEVFGEPPEPASSDVEELNCEALHKKITSFFDYLKNRPYMTSSDSEIDPYQRFVMVAEEISKSLPLVIGETKDIYSILSNQTHFFRILKKENIELVKNILANEKDVLEYAMADFYAYDVTQNCCAGEEKESISKDALYEYAGFFLQTLAGQSYLMRRSSNIRCLVTYYSILIIDKANDEKFNKYGIDIRPHIEIAMDNIRNQKNLVFQDRYLTTLSRLKEKYHVLSD